MTTSEPIAVSAAPFRVQTIERLTSEFGQPECSRNFDRWVVRPPEPRHPVHLMVNGPGKADRAHVLVFDPGAPSGDNVLEMELRAVEELAWLIEHIRQSVAPHPKPVVATDYPATFRSTSL